MGARRGGDEFGAYLTASEDVPGFRVMGRSRARSRALLIIFFWFC